MKKRMELTELTTTDLENVGGGFQWEGLPRSENVEDLRGQSSIGALWGGVRDTVSNWFGGSGGGEMNFESAAPGSLADQAGFNSIGDNTSFGPNDFSGMDFGGGVDEGMGGGGGEGW